MPLSKSDLVRTALFSKCANLVESCYYPLLYHKYDGVSKRENLRYADCGKRAVLDVYRQEKGSPEKLPLFFYIHGGGWVSGKRSVRKYYCIRWTAFTGNRVGNVILAPRRSSNPRSFYRFFSLKPLLYTVPNRNISAWLRASPSV